MKNMTDVTGPDFPSNSRKSREEKHEVSIDPETGEPTKKITKVISGGIVKKKKNILDRFAQTFFGDDAKDVGRFIMFDVLLPSIKNTVVEMVQGGIEMLLFGEARGDRTRRDRDKSYVSYNRMYGGDRNRVRVIDHPEPAFRNRAHQKYEDVIFENRIDAERVLSNLVDLLEEYGNVSVGDFLDAIDEPSDFTDNKWGWDLDHSLSRAVIERGRQGYTLVLPKPVQLD
jgi:hypothetical protein